MGPLGLEAEVIDGAPVSCGVVTVRRTKRPNARTIAIS
jgi:hypothetical protein